jgi:hypothetical protein
MLRSLSLSFSTRLSRRAIAAVAVLFVVVAAGAVVVAGRRPGPSPGPGPGLVHVPIADAVERTVAAPLARVRLDVAVQVEGRDEVRYRLLGDRAWIGGAGAGWLPIPPEQLGGSGAASWRDLLRRLTDDGRGRTSLGGHPATVELDARGRVRHVRALLRHSTVDLRLDGIDDDLAITAPP